MYRHPSILILFMPIIIGSMVTQSTDQYYTTMGHRPISHTGVLIGTIYPHCLRGKFTTGAQRQRPHLVKPVQPVLASLSSIITTRDTDELS